MNDAKTERSIKLIQKFINENTTPDMSMEEINQLVNEYLKNNRAMLNGPDPETAETADDFLSLAHEAADENNKKQALKYAQKALEKDPDSIEARFIITDLSASDPFTLLEKKEALVRDAAEIMEKQGYMENNKGDFWQVVETRPYIRSLRSLADLKTELGMYTEAAKNYEQIIELNQDDNTGARSALVHLYALLEDEEKAEKLYARYNEHDETMILLALAVLNYKKCRFDEARGYLKKLMKINKDTRRFFSAFHRHDLDQYVEKMQDYGYRPFTIEEYIVCMQENHYLYSSCAAFMEWTYRELKKIK